MSVKPIRRSDGRRANELRAAKLTPGFLRRADGSCLIEMGGTRVLCAASIAEGVPDWRAGTGGLGWVTAEYGMLPASTGRRKSRPLLKPDSRGVEIQRLIGRAIRSIVRFDRLGETTIHLDCDVLEADGGTRTAAITGAYVALALAVRKGQANGRIQPGALKGAVTAVSVGLVDGRALLDLCYEEDARADVDMNVAMTDDGKFVELQGTSETTPFTDRQLQAMLRLAKGGIRTLRRFQRLALAKGEKKQ
jgi:ribonuclease PH